MPKLGKRAGAGRAGRRAPTLPPGAAPPAPAPAPAPPPAAAEPDSDPEPEPAPSSPVPAPKATVISFAESSPAQREVPANKPKPFVYDDDDDVSVASGATGTTDTSGDDLLAELGIESHASMGFGGKKKPPARKPPARKAAAPKAEAYDDAELSRSKSAAPKVSLEREPFVQGSDPFAKPTLAASDASLGSSSSPFAVAVSQLFKRVDRANRKTISRADLINTVQADEALRTQFFGLPEQIDEMQLERTFAGIDQEGFDLPKLTEFIHRQFPGFPETAQQMAHLSPEQNVGGRPAFDGMGEFGAGLGAAGSPSQRLGSLEPEPEPEPEPLEADGSAVSKPRPDKQQSVAAWMEDSAHVGIDEDDDDLVVHHHEEGPAEEEQFHAYLARVKGPREAASVLEELGDLHRENIAKDGGANWHCFSHAYRVTDPVRAVVRHHCGDDGQGGEGTARLIAELLELSKPVADDVVLAVMWCSRGPSVTTASEQGIAAPQICCARSLLERRAYFSCFERGAIAQCPHCQQHVKASRVTDVLRCNNADCPLKAELDQIVDNEDPRATPETDLMDRAKEMGIDDVQFALREAVKRGDIKAVDERGESVTQAQQYKELILRLQIRPIHTVGGMWLQPHQLLLGQTDARVAERERRQFKDDEEQVSESAKDQMKKYNPHRSKGPEADAGAVSERARQRRGQPTPSGWASGTPGSSRRQSAGGGGPANSPSRRHHDPYPTSPKRHSQTNPFLGSDTDGTSVQAEAHAPNPEEVKIAEAERYWRIKLAEDLVKSEVGSGGSPRRQATPGRGFGASSRPGLGSPRTYSPASYRSANRWS